MGVLATAFLTLVGTAVAAPAKLSARADQYCDEMTGLCYSEYASDFGITYRIATPEGAEGDYDVALQIVATSDVGWAGIAWGGQMANNPITLGWANGEEAVVSSRWATGHTMPEVYDGATYTILPGSGANDTHWTLSVLCSGCSSWDGGSVDPTGMARLAYGMSTMPPADTSNPASQFGIHQAKGGWEHDMSTAGNADFASLVEAALEGDDDEDEEQPESPMC